MKKILITGANGFIGHTAANYFSKEYEVYGLDITDKYRCTTEEDKNVTYYQCNMSDAPAELSVILTDIQPDVVLHCAGSANVGASVVNPMADLDGNLHSLYQLLIALKGIEKRPKVLFFSSAAVYGNPKSLPISEKTELGPVSPYGLHKQMCEEICSYYNRIHGYNCRALRIFSVYGSAYGFGLRKQLLWDMFQKYSDTKKISLFGTGNESRDFIHVLDLMQAIECVLNHNGKEEIFNVANGEEVFIKDIAAIYAKELGESDAIISFNGQVKAGDPLNWRADIAELKKLGYKKAVDMEQGIAQYIEWAREQ